MNLGAAAARNDLLAFTHDDVLVTPSWFGTLVRALVQAGPRAVLTGKILLTEPECPGGFQLTYKTSDTAEAYEGRVPIDILYPPNMALYRTAFDEAGYFDERLGAGTQFPGAEDNDFGFRLLEKGFRILYFPEAVLYHRAWRARRDYLSMCWGYGYGQGGFYAKHLGIRDRFMLHRMIDELIACSYRFGKSFRRDRLLAQHEGIRAFAILAGAAAWSLKYRLRPAATRRGERG
jgi:GT2 family glycosyltransferase